MRIPDADVRNALLVVNAWVDDSPEGDGTNVVVLLNREAEPDARLGYGLGPNPVCSLVDEADMPLSSFLPRPVE